MSHSSADLIPILYKRYAKAWQKMRLDSPFVEKSWLDRFAQQIPKPDNAQDIKFLILAVVLGSQWRNTSLNKAIILRE